ncbi:MAG: glucuronate isomerase [bacterium]
MNFMSTTNSHFLNENFLLQSPLAQRLYVDHAAGQPIIDYHSHLSPFEVAIDCQYENITKLWLSGDHYKWRAMRTAGVSEKYITGLASDEEKFTAWAKTVPQTIRNPLFHWTALELNHSFGVNEYLNEDTAPSIYKKCNEVLHQGGMTTRKILEGYQVEYLCSTDDPCDDLAYHQQIREDASCKIGVAPSFRPDKSFAIHDKENFLSYLQILSQISGVVISDISSLLEALQQRVDYFASVGCRMADHGLTQIPLNRPFTSALESEFKDFITSNGKQTYSDPEAFVFHILSSLCKMYHTKGWIQQFHLGAIRNNNTRLKKQLGADAGFDSIGDYPQAERLSAFLNSLDSTDQLAKTIIYNLNPADNAVFASMCGNFNDGSVRAKVQYGPAWWFLDQKNGMEQHLDVLSDMSVLSTFVGMITDSRSFLSFSRHEYFRRILCNMLAKDMLDGIIPNDEQWIGKMISNICYHNAKDYLGL